MSNRNCNSSGAPEFTPGFFGEVHVFHLFSFCVTYMCLYGLSSVLWCPLRFPHKNDVQFIFTSSCFCRRAHVLLCFCVCLWILMPDVYWLYEYHGGCLIRSSSCLPVASALVHLLFWCGRVANDFSFLFLVFCLLILLFFRYVCLRPVSCVPNVHWMVHSSVFSSVYISKKGRQNNGGIILHRN